jgi:glyoxylase-like metal-dependent hydrolase (beta-lactamase superfamily II)
MAARFRILHDPRSGAVSYLLADPAAGEAVIVDPRAGDVPVISAMLADQGLRARWLLRTHDHPLGPPGARQDGAAFSVLGAPTVQHQPPHGGVLAFGDELLHVLATPGHTDHCLSFRWRDRLFCGGLLSVDSCPVQPRPLLPAALWESVTQQVFRLPAETLLFSGHAGHGRASSTVFEERRWHPWFGRASRDEFLARVAALPPTPSLPSLPPTPLASPASPQQGLHA